MRELKLGSLGKGSPDPVGRTPPGVRELKRGIIRDLARRICRTPPGVRELKHIASLRFLIVHLSHPSRGA